MSRLVTYQSGGFTNYGISYRQYSPEELEERSRMKEFPIMTNKGKEFIKPHEEQALKITVVRHYSDEFYEKKVKEIVSNV